MRMRVPLLTEFHHTCIRKGTCTVEGDFVTYRDIIQSHCAQIPVARATKFYTVANDVSILRADFPARTKVCITPHVLRRKCPVSEVHRTGLRDFSPRANHTDRAAATGRRS